MLELEPDKAAGAAQSAAGNRQKQRIKTGNANRYGFISISLNPKNLIAGKSSTLREVG
jgi:hypothetical protein